jgi:flagellar hook-length control protein FliK
MANDSITNRLSNETISTFRKNRFETNDLSQASFFDQLLDASTFRSEFELDARNTRATSRSSSGQPDTIRDDKEEVDETDSTDEPSNETVSYAVVLPTPGSAPIDFAVSQQAESTLAPPDEVTPVDEVADAILNPSTKSGKTRQQVTKNGTSNDQANSPNSQLEPASNQFAATEQKQPSETILNKEQSDQPEESESTTGASLEEISGSDRESSDERDGRASKQRLGSPLQLDSSSSAESEVPEGPVEIQASAKEPTHEKVRGSSDTEQDDQNSVSQEQPNRSRRAERLANRAERQSQDSERDGDRNNGSGKSESSQASFANNLVNPEDRVSLTQDSTSGPRPIDSGLNTLAAGSIASNANGTNSYSITASASAAAMTGSLVSDGSRSSSAAGAASSSSASSSIAAKSDSQSSTNTTITGSSNTNPSQASGSRGETVRGATGSTISPYQETKLVQRVLRGLEQLGDGGGQVRLRLHPPELGTLQLTLRMEGGQMQARMEVENSLAKDALLNNVQTLKDRLSEQGMQIESFEVSVGADSANSNGANADRQGGFSSDSRWNNAQSRFAQMNNNRLSSDDSRIEKSPQQPWTRNHGSLDLTV